ncbi:MAG: phage tail protein [Burkholderiales bacterium]|nr:phage tail protein [Burkholderiales bacterium]
MSEWYLGEIRNFAGKTVPKGWLPCSGQLLGVNQNQALFSLIGTAYGGDGRVNFALPDLRGRVAVGSNPTDYTLGAKGGLENVTLTTAQIPRHSHAFNARLEAGTTPAVADNYLSSAGGSAPQAIYAQPGTGIPLNPQSIGNYGGSGPHNNLQPYLATNYCIAVTGIYPSRN